MGERKRIQRLEIRTRGKGLHEITREVEAAVARAGLDEGLCTVYLRHTSASLVIQENADPSAKRDLEAWLERLVPEGDPLYTHTAEGPDDIPSHIKAALTSVSLAIPVLDGRLALGAWQGIYLWEHRGSAACARWSYTCPREPVICRAQLDRAPHPERRHAPVDRALHRASTAGAIGTADASLRTAGAP